MKSKEKELENDPLNEDTSTQDDKDSETLKEGQDNKDNESDIKIPKHRFDEVNEKAKTFEEKANKLEAKLKEIEEKDLEEQKKYKELYEKKEAELEDVKKSKELAEKEKTVIKEAYRVGVREDALDDVVKLIDLDELDAESDISSTVDSFVETKPYLLSKGSKDIGTKTTKSKEDVGGKEMWKESEIQQKATNHRWYQEHKDEIKKARAEGRVIDDLK